MDSTSIPDAPTDVTSRLTDGVDGLRVGVVKELFLEGTEPGVLARVREGLDRLERLGARLEECSLPSFEYALSAYYLIAPAECSSNLARYDGVRWGLRAKDSADVVDMMQRTRQAGFGAEVKRRVMLGTYALSAGYYDAYYGQAQKVRTLVRRELEAAYERFDLLVGPTAPTVAFPIGEKADDPLAMYLNDVFTIPVNLAGNAAVSVPAGLSDGLPVGLQLIAPALGEATMLRAAWAFEQDLGLSTRPVTPHGAPAPGPRRRRSRGGTPVTAPVASEVGARRYETVIGIETHCELGTATKMFCACPTAFGAGPNTQTCPVCLGEPGSLPVANGRAVEYAARIGLALHCRIAERSQFHRKNYFYPDMPKNYQISQYDEPLCVGGWLDVDVEGEVRRIGITRVHLEEDTGKSLHVGATGRIHGADYSLVDYNRAGIPLVEIVSEPDLRTADEARAYAEELRAVLLALGVSDAKLEEGSMRFDVNVSIRPVGHAELGTKIELKNLNSLRSLHRAVAYEADRQRRVLAEGGRLTQETRHWDEGASRTEPMRSKEFATDYRYFPEPDLVPIEATASWVGGLRADLPELPAEGRARLAEATGLPAKEVGWLVRDPEVLAYFQAVATGRDPKTAAGWVMGELQRDLREFGHTMASNPVGPERLGQLLDMVSAGTVSATAAKDVLAEMFNSEASPSTIVERKGLAQISDSGELEAVVARVVAANPDLAEKFRGGKRGVLGALVGQVMRETRGRANPKLVSDLLERIIGG